MSPRPALLTVLIVLTTAARAKVMAVDLLEENKALREENKALREALERCNATAKTARVSSWASLVSANISTDLARLTWRLENAAPDVAETFDGRTLKRLTRKRNDTRSIVFWQRDSNAFALMWWRLTRLLFAADMLPVDATGGKHRGYGPGKLEGKHRGTIPRQLVHDFMSGESVQRAISGATHCAEVGDKHFLNQYAPHGVCAHKYAIDIKDKVRAPQSAMYTPQR